MDDVVEDDSLLALYIAEIKKHTSLPPQELNRIEALMVQFAVVAAMDSKVLASISEYSPKYVAYAAADGTILDF